MDSKMVERISLALNSDDLRLMQQACPLDKVISSGWSAKNEPLGSVAFWSKYVRDSGRVKELLRRSKAVVVSRARRMRMGGSVADLQAVATVVVAYWLSDKCQACHGRGFYVAQTAQIATGDLCPSCRGSGLAPTPTPADAAVGMSPARFDRLAMSLINTLDQAMCGYVAGTLANLRRESS